MKKIAVFFVCLAVLVNAAAFAASAESGDGNSSVIDEGLDAENDNQGDSAEDPTDPDDGPTDLDDPADPENPDDAEDDISDDMDDVDDPTGDSGTVDPSADPDEADDNSEDPGSDDPTEDAGDSGNNNGPDDRDDPVGNAEKASDTDDGEGSRPVIIDPKDTDDDENQAEDPDDDAQGPSPATTPAKPPAKKANICVKKTTEGKEETKNKPEEKIGKENLGGTSGDNVRPMLIFFRLQPVEPMRLAPLTPPKVEEGFICFIEDFIFGKDMILHNNSIEINDVTLVDETTDHKTTQTVTADILSVKGRSNRNVTLVVLHMDAPAELFEQTINHTMAMERSNTVEVRFDGLSIKKGDLLVIAVTSPDRIKLYAAEMYKVVFSEYKDGWVLFNLTD